MNCLLNNQTPLAACLENHRDKDGRQHILLIAKACWHISSGRMAAAEQQVALRNQPLRRRLGDLINDPAQEKALQSRMDEEVTWLDHDLSPPKPFFDVVLAGHIVAPAGYRQTHIDAGFRIGTHVASMRGFVPRYWQSGWLGHRQQALSETISTIPISYALADWSQGFTHTANGGQQWMPWIEAHNQPSKRRKHPGTPAGLGVWPENAPHRLPFIGTCDEQWQQNISPELPKDFDTRFYNLAHPDAQIPMDEAPRGGTPIRLIHLSQQAIVDSVFPSLMLAAQTTTAAGVQQAGLALTADTLIVEAEQDRMSVIWRALIPRGTGQSAIRTVRLYRTGKYSA